MLFTVFMFDQFSGSQILLSFWNWIKIWCASEKRAQPDLIFADWATSLTVYIHHKSGGMGQRKVTLNASCKVVGSLQLDLEACLLAILLQNSRAPTRRRHQNWTLSLPSTQIRSSILLFRLLEIILGTLNALGTVKCWADCQRQLLHHQKGNQQNVGGLGSQSSLPHIKPTKHYFQAMQEIPTTRTAMAA